MGEKLKVGILGATGAVGQRFIQLLEDHPWFEVHALGASERSAGLSYREAARSWKLETPIPPSVAAMKVLPCKASFFTACHLVFSGLDSSVAGDVEEEFVSNEIPVFSNAKNHRMDPDVPLVVPLVNGDHLDIIPLQQKKRGLKKGFLVCNANCSTTGLVVPLRPLEDLFGIQSMIVTTMQAISGAGYPGVSSMDIIDNVIPFISGEEDKIETEPLKILGHLNKQTVSFDPLSFGICASCNRVPVLDGHSEMVVVKLKRKPTLEELKAAISGYESEAQRLRLPSAPAQACVVLEEDDRPQPRMDRNRGRGFTVSVGRVRESPVLDFKLCLLSHNTILGAAGSAILNAEFAKVKGYL